MAEPNTDARARTIYVGAVREPPEDEPPSYKPPDDEPYGRV
jgi:hypothetical protein